MADENTNPGATGASDPNSQTPRFDASKFVPIEEYNRVQDVLASTQEEAKGYRKQRSEAKKQAEEQALANGEFKALAESRAETIADLQAQLAEASPKAKAYDADSATRTAALKSNIESLPPEQQAMVLGGKDLATQEQLAAHFLGVTPSTSVKPDTKAPTPPDDSAATIDPNDAAALLKLSNDDPEAFAKLMAANRVTLF